MSVGTESRVRILTSDRHRYALAAPRSLARLSRALLFFIPPRVRDRALDVPVLAQQLGRRLRPDALDAWNDVGVELKGVRSGVERRRGVSGLKARDPGRRETTAKVLEDRRSPRERGRMGTSVILERARDVVRRVSHHREHVHELRGVQVRELRAEVALGERHEAFAGDVPVRRVPEPVARGVLAVSRRRLFRRVVIFPIRDATAARAVPTAEKSPYPGSRS